MRCRYASQVSSLCRFHRHYFVLIWNIDFAKAPLAHLKSDWLLESNVKNVNKRTLNSKINRKLIYTDDNFL
jgi:hypothetical protein